MKYNIRPMHPPVEAKREAVEALCREYGVLRLYVFGSATNENFDDRDSDIDLLVEFHPDHHMDAADRYFGLLFALEELFERRVDLVSAKALRNPYFIEAVNETRRLLYAA